MAARAALGFVTQVGRKFRKEAELGREESSLSVLVFCAIKKPKEINITYKCLTGH